MIDEKPYSVTSFLEITIMAGISLVLVLSDCLEQGELEHEQQRDAVNCRRTILSLVAQHLDRDVGDEAVAHAVNDRQGQRHGDRSDHRRGGLGARTKYL